MERDAWHACNACVFAKAPSQSRTQSPLRPRLPPMSVAPFSTRTHSTLRLYATRSCRCSLTSSILAAALVCGPPVLLWTKACCSIAQQTQTCVCCYLRISNSLLLSHSPAGAGRAFATPCRCTRTTACGKSALDFRLIAAGTAAQFHRRPHSRRRPSGNLCHTVHLLPVSHR
jgi:hypothetical protein